MDKLNSLVQYNAILVRASAMLRQISYCLREKNFERAMELSHEYRSTLQPLLEGLNRMKKN